MGKYKNISEVPLTSPFIANGAREVAPGETVDLPDTQPDGSSLYWSPEFFERLDQPNPIHDLGGPGDPAPNAGPQAEPPAPAPGPTVALEHRAEKKAASGGERN